MGLDRGLRDIGVEEPTIAPEVTASQDLRHPLDLAAPTDVSSAAPSAAPMISTEVSTAMLRRCTALATRARADLLTSTHHDASDELVALLATMEGWEPSALVDPDPTMTVLAAAALQDLAARLPEGASGDLAARAASVTAMLLEVMDRRPAVARA